MPAMIEDNMIAWKNETPWHGLGYQVPDNATGAEMLVIAKLDWHVQRRAIAMRPGDGSKDTMLTEPLKNFRAIVRQDTDTVFQVATDRYYPVQNSQIVEFFREYCEAGHAKMETVGGLKGGAVVWALARLNGGSSANLQGVDELRGYMLLATSHDGSIRTIGKPTQTRVVCWNTLSAAIGEKSQAEFRMKHTRKWSPDVAKEAQEVMGMACEQVSRTNELASRLSSVSLDHKGRLEFVSQLLKADGNILDVVADSSVAFQSGSSLLDSVIANHSTRNATPEVQKAEETRVGKAILEAIISSPGSDLVTAKDTLWGAVNGVTYYADHVRGRSQDSRLNNAWFGTGDALKNDAVRIASQMAGF